MKHSKHNAGPVYAHRVAFENAHGPIPDGMLVMHRCDNPPCVNPEHLVLGYPVDNIRDAWRKGRLPKPPRMAGEDNPRAKLSAKAVEAIREVARQHRREGFQRFRRGGGVVKGLAKKYGVTDVMIWNVIRGANWTER